MADHTHELHADARAHFMATMGFDHDLDDHSAWGTVTIGSYLQSAPGWPGVAALLTFADVLIGRLASQRTAPRISVTADLGIRVIAAPPPDGVITMTASLVKAGRSMSVGETEFRAAGSGDLIATSLGTFLASPRPIDEVPDGFANDDRRPADGSSRAAETFVDQVGLRIVGDGAVEITLRPDLLNATQSLQGGLVALLGEVAAQNAATSAAGHPHVVDSLEVHYLAAARVGPFRGTGRVLAVDRNSAVVRVEVRDPGRDDRVVSVLMATTRPGPS